MTLVNVTVASAGQFVAAPVLGSLSEEHSFGQVVAVFNRSILIEMPTMLVSIVSPVLGAGPYSLVLNTNHEFIRLKQRCCLGQTVRVEHSVLQTSAWWLDCSSAPCWRGRVAELGADRRSVADIQQRLSCLSEFAPECLLYTLQDDSTAFACQTDVRTLAPLNRSIYTYLVNVMQQSEASFRTDMVTTDPVCEPMRQLLGVGNGLTPTGDDVLVGILLAWSLLYRLSMDDEALVALENSANASTQPFSAQFVMAAAQGYCGEALYRVMEAITAGAGFDAQNTAQQIQCIGHSSGWDTLVGIRYAFQQYSNLRHSPGHDVDQSVEKPIKRISHA